MMLEETHPDNTCCFDFLPVSRTQQTWESQCLHIPKQEPRDKDAYASTQLVLFHGHEGNIDNFTEKPSFTGKDSIKEHKNTNGRDEGKYGFKGVSLRLNLYENPWTVEKALKGSDLGQLSRLLISSGVVKSRILPFLASKFVKEIESEGGLEIDVLDVDTMSHHALVFKLWASSKSYVLMGKWRSDFVKRRGLKEGNKIGLQLDPSNCSFNFSVLERA